MAWCVVRLPCASLLSSDSTGIAGEAFGHLSRETAESLENIETSDASVGRRQTKDLAADERVLDQTSGDRWSRLLIIDIGAAARRRRRRRRRFGNSLKSRVIQTSKIVYPDHLRSERNGRRRGGRGSAD